jgi:hypothetical protein
MYQNRRPFSGWSFPLLAGFDGRSVFKECESEVTDTLDTSTADSIGEFVANRAVSTALP